MSDHVEFPKMLYRAEDTRVVADAEEQAAAAADGFVDAETHHTPAKPEAKKSAPKAD